MKTLGSVDMLYYTFCFNDIELYKLCVFSTVLIQYPLSYVWYDLFIYPFTYLDKHFHL